MINVFTPGTGNGGSIAVSLAELTPLLNYSENGVMFGFNVNHRFDCGKWDVGMRLDMPFRAITVATDNAVGEQSILDLVNGVLVNNPFPEEVTNNDGTPAFVTGSFAYRLDALAALPSTTGLGGSFVNFSNPGFANQITIDNLLVTNAAGPQASPVHVLGSTTTPTPAFSRVNGLVDKLPLLAADGSDVANGAHAQFASTINYTPLGNNIANQRTLWVVPTDFNTDPANPGSPLQISTAAQQIRADVTALLQNQLTVAEFLAVRGINFNTQRLTGAGDLDVDFYARRNFCEGCHGGWYVEGITGIRFPTGKKVKNPGNLFAQPLGNNGHFEIKGGAQVGWNPCDWFAVKADAQFYHVFRRNEKVAAAFTGATVRNIGTTVDASVSWNYFLGNLDLTFVHQSSCDGCMGVDIGYQPYFKLKDKISFKETTAMDLLGNVQTLDATVLEANTKRSVHRIKTEVFHKNCDWEIYGGWLHSVAGKNIQRETDWYAGFGIFF